MDAVHAQDGVVVVSARVLRQVELNVWIAYARVETFADGTERKRLVVDPHGTPYPGVDPELNAASVDGIPRELTGPQWEIADANTGAANRVHWEIPALRDQGVAWSGDSPIGPAGTFRIEIRGDTLRAAARMPVATIVLRAGPQGSPGARGQWIEKDLDIPRATFVRAVDHGS